MIDLRDSIHHRNIIPIPDEQRILVNTTDDIDREIGKWKMMYNSARKGEKSD